MVKSSVPAQGRIFISYRRQETRHLAGRLYDHLANRFGDAQVFMDVDSIAPGVDFAESIALAVGTSDVLLALIGHQWLTVTDDEGQRRRLDDPHDIVRLEINAALERDIRVIPVLVDGASIPRQQSLPDDLAILARRQAIPLRHDSFRPDSNHLVEVIEKIFSKPPTDSSAVQRPRVRQASSAGVPMVEFAVGLIVGLVVGLTRYYLSYSSSDWLAFGLADALAFGLSGALAGVLARKRPPRDAWWVSLLVFGLGGWLSSAVVLAVFGLSNNPTNGLIIVVLFGVLAFGLAIWVMANNRKSRTPT